MHTAHKNNPPKQTKQHFVLDICIGHRGLAAHAPENTLPSITAAAMAGLSWVEIDVRLCRNGIVLSHDADLLRCCGMHGRIATKTTKQLAQTSAHCGFAKQQFQQATIPTLCEAMKIICKHKIGVVIEIKPARNLEMQTLTAVANALPNHYAKMMISSFSMPMLLASQKILPHIPRAYNRTNPTRESMTNMQICNAANIHCGTNITPTTIKRFASCGYGVYCFTTDSLTQAQHLLNAGAHGVFSNTNLLPKLKSSQGYR